MAASLRVGDPAPPFKPGKWVQGEPVREFSGDKAYLVEFWATWCGPCVSSIPHLNDISNKYKDKGLVVVGHHVENDEKLASFMKKMGEKMAYRISTDDLEAPGQTPVWMNWGEASGAKGIPTAFLVGKDGKIAFIGHPNALKESVIEAVLAGKFDTSKAAADWLKEIPTPEPHSKPGPLDGVWINVDTETRSIPKVEIKGNQIVYWGKTHPQDSKYGPFSLTLSGESVNDSAPNKYGYLSTDVHFAQEIAMLKLVDERLFIDWLTVFKDGSDRSNFHLSLTFTKQPKAAPLRVGDQAPPLKTGKWLHGDPVTEFSRTKAYLVGFWSRSRGFCFGSLFELNRIANKYKDKGLVVIGQNVLETNESVLEPLLKKMGDQLAARLALDDKKESEEGSMMHTWLNAAELEQTPLPYAFLIGKDGRIAFMGSPNKLSDRRIEQALSGTFDIQKAAEEAKKEKETEENEHQLSKRFSDQLAAKQWGLAEETLSELIKLLPQDREFVVLEKKVHLLLGKGEKDAAAEAARKLCTSNIDHSSANNIAWLLLSQKNVTHQTLSAGWELAKIANQETGDKHVCTLDTLARAEFLNGNKEKAIELETKALDFLKDCHAESCKQQLEELVDTLKSYKAGKLPE